MINIKHFQFIDSYVVILKCYGRLWRESEREMQYAWLEEREKSFL